MRIIILCFIMIYLFYPHITYASAPEAPSPEDIVPVSPFMPESPQIKAPLKVPSTPQKKAEENQKTGETPIKSDPDKKSILTSAPALETAQYALFSLRKPGMTDLITRNLDVQGFLVYQNKSDGTGLSNKKSEIQKISVLVTGSQTYEEALLKKGNLNKVPASEPTQGVWAFSEDSLTRKVGDNIQKLQLNPSERIFGVDISDLQINFFRPEGVLTREELEQIDTQANSLILDWFLPEKEVKLGESWMVSADLLGVILKLDLIYQMDVKTRLDAVKNGVAILVTEGWVEGSAQEVTSKIVLKAKIYYDLKIGRIIWFGLLTREKRSPENEMEGMEMVAREQYTIKPLRQPTLLTKNILEGIRFDPAYFGLLLLKGQNDSWSTVASRHWELLIQDDLRTSLRFLHKGNIIAQCTINVTQNPQTTKMLSLSSFTQSIQDILGKEASILSSTEEKNAVGLRKYRVEASGKVQTVPIRWIYYLVTDTAPNAAPRQITVMFSLEEKNMEIFSTQDVQFMSDMKLH